MRIIRPRKGNISRYATLKRDHYICPDCKIWIVRDRQEDMFLCLQCGRKETRQEFRQTLIGNIAASQKEWRKQRERDARRDRLRRALNRDEFREQIGAVYYIQLRDLIKIGTTVDLRSRLSNLPWDTLLLTEPGYYEVENKRHRQFADLRHDGEWFRADQPLLEFIEQRRQELQEDNRKRYGDRPDFPWKKRSVNPPSVYEVVEALNDDLEWGDAIEVNEIECSSRYYCNDQDDVVGL